jgi:anti-sigma regulatory factor (Ser/Thr protein kinase)
MQGDRGTSLTDEHLAILGHEMRNALNGIVGVTELLARSGLNGEQQQLLKALQQSGRQLHWLLDAVGAGARKTEFSFTPVLAEINGIDLLEQAIRCHTPAAMMNDNLLLLKVEPGLPAGWYSDVRLLRLLINNLLSNAIKFTHSGMVELQARRSAGEPGEDSRLELLVRDSGPGISRADSSRIFEPWVQIGDRRVNGGVGLGLHVCSRVVAALHGVVEYQRAAGSGSCFSVFLPGAVDPTACWEPGQISELFTSMQCLVSAQENLRASLSALLSRLGVRTVSGGTDTGCEPGIEIQILISEPEEEPGDNVKHNGLLFTHQPLHRPARKLLPVRLLRPPYLESTLGPLLMGMALEWRMTLQPRRGGSPGMIHRGPDDRS